MLGSVKSYGMPMEPTQLEGLKKTEPMKNYLTL